MENLVSSHGSATKPLEEYYSGRKCLVTGHTGFKGSWLSVWLHRLGAQICGYALQPPTEPSLFDLAEVGEFVQDNRGDLRDFDHLRKVVAKVQPEIVFHLAAQPLVRRSYREPKATFDVNVGGTVNLLEALRESATVRAAVVVTSDKCYENREWDHSYRENDPLGGRDPYSASKAAAEMVANAYRRSFFEPAGVGLTTARAGNAIGGGDWAENRIIPDAVRALASDSPVPVRHPDSVRPWQHVLEPLYGYLLLGAKLLQGSQEVSEYAGAWNFGPAPSSFRTVKDVADLFIRYFGKGSWEDKSGEQNEAQPEAKMLALAWEKAYLRLGWSPRWGFEETIERTAKWYRALGEGTSARDLCTDDIEAFCG